MSGTATVLHPIGTTVAITPVNASSVSGVLTVPTFVGECIRILNGCNVDVFVAFGTSVGQGGTGATADLTGLALLPGQAVIIDVGSTIDTIATFPLSTPTGNVYCQKAAGGV